MRRHQELDGGLTLLSVCELLQELEPLSQKKGVQAILWLFYTYLKRGAAGI